MSRKHERKSKLVPKNDYGENEIKNKKEVQEMDAEPKNKLAAKWDIKIEVEPVDEYNRPLNNEADTNADMDDYEISKAIEDENSELQRILGDQNENDSDNQIDCNMNIIRKRLKEKLEKFWQLIWYVHLTDIFCKICNKNMKFTLNTFKTHLYKQHTDPRIFEVEITDNTVNIITAIDKTKPIVDLKCYNCDKTFQFRIAWSKHVLDKFHECTNCWMKYRNCKDLTEHTNGNCKAVSASNHRCGVCLSCFRSAKDLLEHKTTVHRVNSDEWIDVFVQKCLYCQGKYVGIRAAHYCKTLGRRVPCGACGKRFQNSLHRAVHLKASKKNKSICHICGHVMQLDCEKETHACFLEKRLQCTECMSFFNTRDEVIKHLIEEHRIWENMGFDEHILQYGGTTDINEKQIVNMKKGKEAIKEMKEVVEIQDCDLEDETQSSALILEQLLSGNTSEPTQTDVYVDEEEEDVDIINISGSYDENDGQSENNDSYARQYDDIEDDASDDDDRRVLKIEHDHQPAIKIEPDDQTSIKIEENDEIENKMSCNDPPSEDDDVILVPNENQEIVIDEDLSINTVVTNAGYVTVKTEPIEYPNGITKRMKIKMIMDPLNKLVVLKENEDILSTLGHTVLGHTVFRENGHEKLVKNKKNKQEISLNCHMCNVKFESLELLLSHIDTLECADSCKFCSFRSKDAEQLEKHILKHILQYYNKKHRNKKDVVYECIQCDLILPKELLKEHWESHKEQEDDLPVKFKDEPPSFRGDVTKLLTASLTRKNKAEERICVACSKIIIREQDFKRHCIEHLLSDAMFKGEPDKLTCQLCDQDLESVMMYKQHMRFHGRLTLYQCNICMKTFSDSSNFTKHRKVHNLQCVICDLCNKKYTSKAILIKHLQSHATTEPVNCKICNQQFPFISTYKRHMKYRHQREDKYVCQKCKARFRSLKDKWNHIWYVHKIRKVKADCPYCPAAYRRYHDVKTHIGQAHSGFPIPNRLFFQVKKI